MGRRSGISKVAQLRNRENARLMVSVGLWANLHNLADEILAGKVEKLPEFQQMIQYAPQSLKTELLNKIDKIVDVPLSIG